MSCPFEMNFTLSASPLSNLPPILNAVEIMSTLDTKKIMTEEDDVEAVNNVKKAYTVTRDDWQGDPCSPSNLSWSGLNCTYYGTPRIISLNLSSSNLTGEVARALMDLTELTSLDLSHNQLTGQIPDLFDQMPKLKILNLSGNNLSGSIPQSLKKKQTAGTLLARFDGNPNLCRTDTCSGKVTASTRENGKYSTNLIIAISVSACVVILLGILATLWGIKRGQRQGVEASTGSGDGPLIVGIPKGRKETIFKYSEISAITNNFGTIIGQGGFGKVYLGILSCGTEVAVKISSGLSSHTYREFLAEVGLLMTVHHKNLVSLIGYCDETESMVLIYEFMSNGDLKQHLSENNAQVLGWSQRLSIAVDAAQGIEYLHNGCRPSIIHRDLKTTNILLNESMQAKIADFGLSKALTAEEDASQVSTRIAGTPGYLDPEFHSSGILTKKSDVYSFGIVLLELITGRPAIKKSPGISLHIIDWVTPLVERGDIQSIVDSRLRGQLKDSAAWKVVEIAMSCIIPSSCKRPNMEGVLSDLKECLRLETGIGYDNYMDNSASLEMPSAELDVAPKPR